MSVVIDISKVGLVIWGVQSGHRVFCFNSAVSDPNIPEIKATWGDIRNLVVVNNLSVVFYALEFSLNYKVFTVYRPVNDFGRSGGYVAVTIYVPHEYKLLNIRGLLESISQAYLSDHYSFGEPLNTPETIGRYQQMLIAQAGSLVLDDEYRSWRESEQNHLTKLLPFNDPSVVDHFFATPYREDFSPYQEVMFWNLNYLQNPAQFGINFLRELERFELNGTDVSEEYQGDRISALSGLTMTFFRKNGVDCKDSYTQKGYYGPTRIAFELVKNEYCQPVSFDGTVDEAVQRGFLVKTGKSYSWRSGIRFEPRTFPLSIQFSGLEGVSGILKAGLDERSLHVVREGRLDLELKGEEVQYQKSLYLEEFGLKRKVKNFVPEDLPKFAGRYLLEVSSLRFVPISFVGENAELPSRLSFKVRGFDGLAALDPRSVSGLILSEDQSLSDIELSVDKYESRIEEDRFLLKKTHVLVRIILPSALESSVKASGVKFGLRFNGGELKLFRWLEAEIRYDDLPKDGAFKLYLFPNSADNSVIFPFEDPLVEETSEGIIIKPRLMKVNNPERTEFWQGSPTSQRRLWVCHDRKSCPYIPEATMFASDEDGFRFEISQKDGYSVLNVKGKHADVPAEDLLDRIVGDVYFSKEETGIRTTVSVFERDKDSDGVYLVKLSREQGIYCLLPFPYDDNKFAELQKSFDPRLRVNATAAKAYNVVLKDENRRGKTAVKSDVRSGGGKTPSTTKRKKGFELPAWTLYAIIGTALVALLLSLWFIFLYKGSKQGDITFEIGNLQNKDIPVTITKNPRNTKAHGNVLSIYKKYERGDNKGTIKGVELSFGEKSDGDYSDGRFVIDGDKRYTWNDDKKYICRVSIPSLDALEKANSLDSIASVVHQFSKSTLIKNEAIDKAKQLVNDDQTLNKYKELFSSIDTSSFIKDWQTKIDEENAAVAAIESAKNDLKEKYRVVRSMDCSEKSVKELEIIYKRLQDLGVPISQINNICGGRSCAEVIRIYKLFFDELDHGSLESFKRQFKYPVLGFTSLFVQSNFTSGQQAFISKLVGGTSDFKRYQGYYKGEGGIRPQTSFKDLNNR